MAARGEGRHAWGMELILVGLMIVVGTFLPWAMDSHLKLRKRVADLERAVGIGKPDPIADALEETR